MRDLKAAEWLEVWERGQSEPPLRRALLLLAAACDDTPVEQLAGWSIGRRDAALLRLRQQLFGINLASRTTCPVCEERVEFQLRCADLLEPSALPLVEALRAQHGQWEAEYRLPTSLDLETLDAKASPDQNRRLLLARCVLELRRGGGTVALKELSPELEAAVAAGMAAADPHAELRLELNCQECGHRWQALLDVVSYLWTELHTWAVRLLRDVHALAFAYGWSEAEILALNVRRRQLYLQFLRE